jgi:hypothetical protein
MRWPVSKRANGSRAKDENGTLITIEGSIATSEEILAATMALRGGLGQFD